MGLSLGVELETTESMLVFLFDATDVTDQLPAGSSAGEWVTITGVSSFDTITLKRQDGSTVTKCWTFWRMEMPDGRLLVDKLWNVSQNWSGLLDIPNPTAATKPGGTFTGFFSVLKNVATIETNFNLGTSSATFRLHF